MSEMRLMEKLRLQKLTDFSYVWDTTYTTICNRAGDDYAALVRTTAYTDTTTFYGDYPTYHVNTINFILPRRYKYTTVFDGVSRGNIKLAMSIGGEAGNGTLVLYARIRVHLKGITSTGTTRTLATSGYSSVFSGTGSYQNSWSFTVDVPFLFDVDNAVLENDERLLISIDVETTGQITVGNEARSSSVKVYHTINTDESFIEIPIVP